MHNLKSQWRSFDKAIINGVSEKIEGMVKSVWSCYPRVNEILELYEQSSKPLGAYWRECAFFLAASPRLGGVAGRNVYMRDFFCPDRSELVFGDASAAAHVLTAKERAVFDWVRKRHYEMIGG